MTNREPRYAQRRFRNPENCIRWTSDFLHHVSLQRLFLPLLLTFPSRHSTLIARAFAPCLIALTITIFPNHHPKHSPVLIAIRTKNECCTSNRVQDSSILTACSFSRTDWIPLPNQIYGSFQRSLTDGCLCPAQRIVLNASIPCVKAYPAVHWSGGIQRKWKEFEATFA